MSWIAIDDAVGVILFVLEREDLRGPVNVVAPHPVTNLEYTKTLGHVLSRPTIFFVPKFAARMAFGEVADALLLSSARVKPLRLTEAGYQFQYPQLEGALRHIISDG
jgi:NAD dependent epimerase/dehydratase family enzyme